MKKCHYKDEAGLSYGKHALQSLACAWYFAKMTLFCLLWHPIFPNINSKYATTKLNEFHDWYAELNKKLKK